ncbi:hypothetical protein DSLASN_01640 [Desulfoluna limicola]|uniref:Uncharacterized protein n=1 Tax=Desulfoluna limicola TaxID=2810562 RepID=A0ABN6EZ75_9BACT|nr:hypothetical protein DSLASN_01640 [Desulfoluna limicola]
MTSAAFACILFLVNYKKILVFFEYRKKNRVANLVEALKCDQITGLTKSHLEEELAAEHFKLSTGIRLDKEFREELIKAYRDANGAVRFDHYKRAVPHMLYENKIFSVHIGWFDWGSAIVNGLCCLVMVVLGFPLLFFSYFIEGITLIPLLERLIMGVVFWIIAIFSFYQVLPVISARHVDGALGKRESKGDEEEQNHEYEGLAS